MTNVESCTRSSGRSYRKSRGGSDEDENEVVEVETRIVFLDVVLSS